VLRCPGPLVTLRCLAALYRVTPQRLAELLPACETRAGHDALRMPGALQLAVSDALGAGPLAPTFVHYFHAGWLHDPPRVLEAGLRPSPATPDAIWQQLGELVRNDMPSADWASLQPAAGSPDDRLLRRTEAPHRGPRGSLVCDRLLRPGIYGTHDHLELPALVANLSAAGAAALGFDLAERFAHATTPCIVEYRRCPAPDGHDIDAALWFVAAALRGAVSPSAVGGHDAHGAPIEAYDILSVRSTATQREWTPGHPLR
jgi:hypothetical protein